MKYLPVGSALFTENRKRFVKQMQPNSIAIFNSNDELPTNGDQLHTYKQNSDLYWLCGIDQEDTMVLLYPDNPDADAREILVLVRPNEQKEKWDGKRLTTKQATSISGIQYIIWLDSLEAQLQVWIHSAQNIYLNTNENDRKANQLQVRDYRYAVKMKEQYPLHNYLRSAVILKHLRSIKTAAEIEVMKVAMEITNQTF